MSDIDYEAHPLGRANIREFATEIRRVLGYANVPFIQIDEMFELVLPEMMDDFVLSIRYEDEMGATHGLADPDANEIHIREDVWIGACQGSGRDRFTVVHEFGHLLLHQKERLTLRRGDGKPVTYCDPEWQADCFAGEFLVSHRLVGQFASVAEVAQAFGVSESAAKLQIKKFASDGIHLRNEKGR